MKLQMILPTGVFWDGLLGMANSWKRLRYLPNIRSPRSFNEYFLREKMFFSGDVSLARTVTDKVEFKHWLQQIGLNDLIVPSIKLVENIRDLEGYTLPKRCIIKPSHSSGHVLLINGSTERTLSEQELVMLDGWLKEDYYLRGREPNYFGLKPRLIVEELLLDQNGQPPCDYKIFCVNGTPFVIQVDLGRFTDHTRQLYTLDWKLLPFSMFYPRNPNPIPKPVQLQSAIEIASKLSRGFSICRIDLYFIGTSDIRAGEVTFFPGNCAERFEPKSGDFELGKMISSLLSKRSSVVS